jgi:hypothetical protein
MLSFINLACFMRVPVRPHVQFAPRSLGFPYVSNLFSLGTFELCYD